MSTTREPRTLLLTGGCGFIGSNFARTWVANGGEVVDLDALTSTRSSGIERISGGGSP